MRETESKAPGRHAEWPPNAAIALYEMDADEVLDETGRVVMDSSLGVLRGRPDAVGRRRRRGRPH